MSSIAERNARYFPHFIPAHEVYLALAESVVPMGGDVLHLGAGRDAMGVVARLAGRNVTAVDPDERGLALNPASVKIVADGCALPLQDASFDLVLCEHVFEHLECPTDVLSECSRVLRRGGMLLFLTPNRWSYIAVIAALTPYRFHVWYKSLMCATAVVDTFPTYYRLNTRREIERHAKAAGLRLEKLDCFVGWPTYLEINPLIHRFGILLHKLIEAGPTCLHISLVGVLKK